MGGHRQAGFLLLLFSFVLWGGSASAVNWLALPSCGGRLAVVGHHTRPGEFKTSFQVIFTVEGKKVRRVETLLVEDPWHQVDLAHPFEVALGDYGAHDRLAFTEESLKKRHVKKKVFISDREVKVVSSEDDRSAFTPEELTGRAPVILVLTKPVDENINGTLHGVISELYLGELEVANERFATSTRESVNAIVAEALNLPQFQGRDERLLKAQCKRILFLRSVWAAKQGFYDKHPDIRPPYAANWSSDPQDRILNEQQIEFYANAEHDPIPADFARFVMPKVTPGMELPFFSPPPLPL